MEVKYLTTPEFEELEARYDEIIDGIFTKARDHMIGASIRSQAHIHQCAIEQARPFIEELGRLRSQLLTTVVVSKSELDGL